MALVETADEQETSFRVRPTFGVMMQGLLVLADLFGFVFVFPVVLVTVVPVRPLFQAWRQYTYRDLMETTLTAQMLVQLQRLGCCSGACGRLLRHALRTICPIIGIFVASLFLVPMLLVTLLSCNHHTLFLIMRLRRVDSFGTFGVVVVSCFFSFLTETIISAGLNYVCFYAVLATLYRFPALLTDLVQTAENRDRHCDFYPLAAIFKHGFLFLLDLLSTLFVFVPVLITCQRMPYLVRRLRHTTYREAMDWTVGQIFCAEFREIGYSTETTAAQDAANKVVGYQP